jgi:hypothetical protein
LKVPMPWKRRIGLAEATGLARTSPPLPGV